MKYFFVEPVCYGFFYTPLIGVPTLLGILENNNHEGKYIGLNNDFINKCFDEDFYNDILERRNAICSINKEDAPIEFHKFIERLENIKSQKTKIKVFDNKKNAFARKIYKTKKLFLNEFLFEFSNKRICLLLQQLGFADIALTNQLLPDIGNYRSDYDIPTFSINTNIIKYYFDNKLSPIDTYLEEQADKIISQNPDCIGISIGIYAYFIPGLLLAYKIKQKSNIHINIGGNFFNEFHKTIDNLSELFGTFFDSISIDDNTKTVTDILKYINGEIPIEEVSNLLYTENGMVKRSKKNNYIKFKDHPIQSFNGYEIESLITPELILPIQTSKGCYWSNCIFCECSSVPSFESKPVSKVVEELEILSKKYNTKYFCFWDNSMHPNYLLNLADRILEKNLKIKFSIYARLEKEFDYKLLKKLKKAGCIKIHWGLDSANQRVLDHINKGISLKQSEKILNNAKKAGIYNMVYIILGHPTETKDEMKDLYSYLKKNQKNINNVYIISRVIFKSKTKMTQQRLKNKRLILSTQQERELLKDDIKKKFPLITTDELNSLQATVPMLLYVEKYGNGFRTILNRKFLHFMKSHPKLLSIYLSAKTKQIEK